MTLAARNAEPLAALAAGSMDGCSSLILAIRDSGGDIVGRAEATGGPVYVLVDVAGMDALGSTLFMSADQMSVLFHVDLLAPAELCRQVQPGMLGRSRGHVVNVSSGYSTILEAGWTPSCASKAGLSHFTAGLRVELAGVPVGWRSSDSTRAHEHMYDTIEPTGSPGRRWHGPSAYIWLS